MRTREGRDGEVGKIEGKLMQRTYSWSCPICSPENHVELGGNYFDLAGVNTLERHRTHPDPIATSDDDVSIVSAAQGLLRVHQSSEFLPGLGFFPRKPT